MEISLSPRAFLGYVFLKDEHPTTIKRTIKLWDFSIQYSVQRAEKRMLLAKRIRSSEFSAVSWRRAGDCRVWPISFRKAAVAAFFPPGSAWAKTSPSRAIKFKRHSVPNKCRRLRQKWELMLRKPRISWLNFCPRWSTN